MKILVTGVAGFIGFNIAKELINRGYEIIGVDVINDYYDVNLKKRRLSKLNDKNFTFCKIDISDKMFLEGQRRFYHKRGFSVPKGACDKFYPYDKGVITPTEPRVLFGRETREQRAKVW